MIPFKYLKILKKLKKKKVDLLILLRFNFHMNDVTLSSPNPDPRNSIEKAELSDAIELEIFNTENKDALINRVPVGVKRLLEERGEELMEYFLMDEQQLRKVVRPTSTLNKLRLAFWFEYDSACNRNKRMASSRLTAGICTREHFQMRTIKNVKQMAWIMTPLSSYKASLEEALLDGVAAMRQMINADLFKDDGRLDTAAANVVLKVYDRLDQRVHGSIVQKMEMKQYSVKKSITESAGPRDIDAELAAVQSKVNANESIVNPEKTNEQKNKEEIVDAEIISND